MLGRNALRLYDVDPVTVACELTPAERESLRVAAPTSFRPGGPTTRAEVRLHVDAERRRLAI